MSRNFKLRQGTIRNIRPNQEQTVGIASNRKKMEEPRFLSGWKEIANYLGKGVRTVQRYERQMGLPARRPAGRPRAAVIATKAEIDAWVAASPIRHEFRLARQEFASSRSSLSSGLKKMHRLAAEMQGLRNELRTCVQALHQSIQMVGVESGKISADRLMQLKPELNLAPGFSFRYDYDLKRIV